MRITFTRELGGARQEVEIEGTFEELVQATTAATEFNKMWTGVMGGKSIWELLSEWWPFS